jgi:hypothetical protein
MNKRNMLLSAAFAGALLAAASAGAQDRNRNGVMDSGDRGVAAPATVENTPTFNQGIPSGVNAMPTLDNRANPSESKASTQRQVDGTRIAPRTDNPNLPNPVSPSAANESAAQPAMRDPTNSSGMEGRSGVGATR